MKNLTLSLTGLAFVAQLAIGGGLSTPAGPTSAAAPATTMSAARLTLAEVFPVAEAQFATQRRTRVAGPPA